MIGTQVEVERLVAKDTGAAAALGVMFAFTLLAGGFGWFLWYKARKQAYGAV